MAGSAVFASGTCSSISLYIVQWAMEYTSVIPGPAIEVITLFDSDTILTIRKKYAEIRIIACWVCSSFSKILGKGWFITYVLDGH